MKTAMNRALGSLSVGVLALGAVNTVSVDKAHALSLTETLIAAYRNNPTLTAGRAELRGVDEGVAQALSGWRPSVSLAADRGVSATNTNTSSGSARRQHRDPWSISASLSQNLYSGGQTIASTSGAELSVKAQRQSLLASEQSILLAAATAYVNVHRDQAVVELNINNEQVLRRQLEAAQDRFEVGEITRTDVHQAEARLSGATADRIGSEGDLDVSRAAYKNVVGEAPNGLEKAFAPQDLPKSIEEALREGLAENPSVKSAEFAIASAQASVEQIRGELLPSVDLTGSASKSFEASTQTSRSDAYTGKITLTVPLYQSGSVYSRLRAAKQTVAQQRSLLAQAERDVEEEVTQAWETLQSTKARIKSYDAQIRAAEVALEGVQREAAVGSRTVLDVLDAEQELLDAKVSLVRAGRDELVASFDLKSALGRLTARAMGLNVDFYDPAVHYRDVREKWAGGNSAGQDSGVEKK